MTATIARKWASDAEKARAFRERRKRADPAFLRAERERVAAHRARQRTGGTARPGGPPATPAEATRRLDGLHPRQRQVLALAAQGLAGEAIARRLGLAWSTVREHLHFAYAALGVHRREEAVVLYRAATEPPPPAPALAHILGTCDDCQRLLPRAALIRYRHDGSWHCEDGAACAAATRARDGEAGR